jgi:hypothetical protein
MLADGSAIASEQLSQLAGYNQTQAAPAITPRDAAVDLGEALEQLVHFCQVSPAPTRTHFQAGSQYQYP